MLRVLAFASLVFAVLSSAAMAQSCSKPDIARFAAQTESSRTAVLAAIPKDDVHATEVPARERAAIADMQTHLGALVSATLRCMPANALPKDVESALQARAPQLDFHAARHAPGLLAVTAEFSVGCGGDTMLAVFQAKDGREVLHLQSKPYKEVSGAWGDFGYVVSTPDAKGNWFVVTKTVAPWCSSTWSTIRYAVSRPSATAPLFQGSDPIWWGGEDMGRLTAGRDDFELRFHAESIDDGLHNREWVRHYRVAGGKAVRIAPLANTPRDFVEEWIQSGWKDAAAWTAPALAPAVKDVHEKFHAKPYGEYRSVRRCGPDTLQVEVQPSEADSSLFFQVAGARDFRMTALSSTADPHCAGKNLYDPDRPQ